jgi:hypothetical protein
LVFLRYFGHHGFGGDQESRDRGRVLDRYANDFGRVDNTRRDQVDIFAGLRVEAVVVLILLEDLADDNGTMLFTPQISPLGGLARPAEMNFGPL